MVFNKTPDSITFEDNDNNTVHTSNRFSDSITSNTYTGKKVPSQGICFLQRVKNLQNKYRKPIIGVRLMRSTPFRILGTQRLLAQYFFNSPEWHQFQPTSISTQISMAHIYDSTEKKISIDKLLAGPNAEVWDQGLRNEFGRLTKGNDAGVSWTDTMKIGIPSHKKVTYCSFVCDIRPHKKKTDLLRGMIN